jgi:DNA repair protein RadC
MAEKEGKRPTFLKRPAASLQAAGLFLLFEGEDMKRLREQLQMYGAKTLSTAELIALVLSSASAQGDPLATASKLLDTYGVGGLKNIDENQLASAGLTKARARLFKVVCELALRLSLSDPGEQKQIVSPNDAAALLQPFMAHLDHEEFRVLVLDTKNRVVANILLYQGTVNSSVLRASEVFRQAVVRNCPGILVAHNHPSSDPSPSPEDLEVTRQLLEAGKLLDIDLLDHIIIGNPRFTSLKEQMRW